MSTPTKADGYEIARSMVAQGISCFPCYSKETVINKGVTKKAKEPLYKLRWTINASNEPNQVCAWFEDQDYFCGVPTGPKNNLLVIDLDTYKEEFDPKDYPVDEWIDKCAVTEKTMRGGTHLFFTCPPELADLSSGQNLGAERGSKEQTGIDWRGQGGYVVLYQTRDFGLCTPPPQSLIQAIRAQKNISSKAADPVVEYFTSYEEAKIVIPAGSYGEFLYSQCPKCSHTRHKSYKECLRIKLLEKEWKCFHCGWQGAVSSRTTILKPQMEDVKEALDHLGVALRYNIRREVREVYLDGKKWPDISQYRCNAWTVIDDLIDSTLRHTLYLRYCLPSKKPFKISYEDWKVIMDTLALRTENDPFLEYIQGIEPWDDVPRLDNLLHECFETSAASEEYIKFASAYPYVSAAARTINPGVKADLMVVLLGPQGIGKSTFWAHAFPLEARTQWYTDALNFHMDEKRLIEAAVGHVFCDVSEMTGATRAEQARMIAYISRQVDKMRLTHRRNLSILPRRYVLVGTTNDDECLPSEAHGLRRFVVVKLEKPKKNYQELQKHLDTVREQLWAEAYARANKKEELAPPVTVANEINETVKDHMFVPYPHVLDALDKNSVLLQRSSAEFGGLTYTQVLDLSELPHDYNRGTIGKTIRKWLIDNEWEIRNNQRGHKGRRCWLYTGEPPPAEEVKDLAADKTYH